MVSQALPLGVSPSKVEFGMVFGFGKLLKQSNGFLVKIARFGVERLELLSASKVKRDQVLKFASG